MNKLSPISIRLPADLKDRLQEIATEDRRTLSNLIEKICADYVRERDHKGRPHD